MSIRKSTYYKTKGIFEKVVGKPIWLKIVDGHGTPFVAFDHDKYYIQLYTDNPKASNDIERYRSFEHELSHIVFDSNLERLMEPLIKKFPNIPRIIIYDIVNIIEDHRVDSFWNKIYHGSKIIRERQLSKACERLHKNGVTHPIDALYAVHCGREDLISPEFSDLISEFKSIIKSVELAGPKATLVASIRALNKIAKYFKHQHCIELTLQSCGTGSKSQSSGTCDDYQDTDDNTQYTDSSEDDISYTLVDMESSSTSEDSDGDSDNDGSGTISSELSDDITPDDNDQDSDEVDDNSSPTDTESNTDTDNPDSSTLSHLIDEINDIIDEMNDAVDVLTADINYTPEDNSHGYYDEPIQLDDDLNKTVDEIIEESKGDGQELLEQIKRAIEEVELSPPKPDANVFIDIVHTGHYLSYDAHDTDKKLANKIAKLLKRIKHKTRSVNVDTGTDIDIDQFIQYKVNKNVTDVFIEDEEAEGMTVLLLVDVSSSMSLGRRIQMAASSALILWDALKQIDNIDFEVYTYYYRDKAMCINKQTYNGLKRIKPVGTTPTDKAIRYVTNLLDRKSGKKFIILITDGEPCYDRHPFSVLASWTYHQIMYARKKGIQVFTFFVGSGISHNIMKQVYGPEYTWEVISDPSQLPKKLINFVTNKIAKTLMM